MLKSFEDITCELTKQESEEILPLISSKLLCHKGEANAIKNAELRIYAGCNGFTVPECRVRKIVEYIRHNNLIEGLIATRKGYFIAAGPAEIESWIKTMQARRNAIDTSLRRAIRTHRKMTRKNQALLF